MGHLFAMLERGRDRRLCARQDFASIIDGDRPATGGSQVDTYVNRIRSGGRGLGLRWGGLGLRSASNFGRRRGIGHLSGWLSVWFCRFCQRRANWRFNLFSGRVGYRRFLPTGEVVGWRRWRCPARLSMFSDHGRGDAPPDVELGTQAHVAGLGSRDQIVQYGVGHILVKGAFVAVGPNV